MTLVAGIFVLAFAAAISWLLAARFPRARFMRAGYAMLAAGGALFVVWAVAHVLAVGVIAAALLLAGGLAGTIGAVRKEIRLDLSR